MSPIAQVNIRSLVDYLGTQFPARDCHWHDWTIVCVSGGRNNLIYRANQSTATLAIKFTVRDERDRAGREYAALSALRQAHLSIAPEPLMLDRTSYSQPVVVQTWLDGEVGPALPCNDVEWMLLLRHLIAVHRITAESVSVQLPPAVVNASTVEGVKALVRLQLERLPTEELSARFLKLLRRFQAMSFPTWTYPQHTLCHVDPNILNYIRRPHDWAAVDWENSGLGDPAYDMADLMTHPAYMGVPLERWNWVTDRYAELIQDGAVAVRIRTYYKMIAVWWVARMARYLYEIPRGLDRRLVAPSVDWQTDFGAKYDHYLRLAESLFT
jgi:aminoglycoside phosphotransferase (APT) family kinase protein